MIKKIKQYIRIKKQLQSKINQLKQEQKKHNLYELINDYCCC